MQKSLDQILKEIDDLQYKYGRVGNKMTKEQYKATFNDIAAAAIFTNLIR